MTIDELRELHNSSKPKRKTSYHEYDIQAEFFRNIRLVYPHLDKLLFHISNEGKRNKRFVKGSGLTKGIADVFLSVSNKEYHGFYIEFKTEQGKQSKDQQEFQKQAQAVGYKYQICRSAHEAFMAVKQYLTN